MLEAATNVIIPDQGDAWHRLRQDDFVQVDFTALSTQLVTLLEGMLCSQPARRLTADQVTSHPVIRCAREHMDYMRTTSGVLAGSPLVGASEDWLERILGSADEDDSMDTSL